MSLVSIELTILDFRYFLDEILTFIEFYEGEEKSPSSQFQTNFQEISRIRQYAIEFIRLIYDLKKLFWDDSVIKEFNLGINFSEQFKNKRVFFFKSVFGRLDSLFNNINGVYALSNELVKLYYNTVQKLIRNTNEFIGYIENARWHRQYALKALDNLVMLCNDFSAIFERFVESLTLNRKVTNSRLQTGNNKNEKKKLTRSKTNQQSFYFMKASPQLSDTLITSPSSSSSSSSLLDERPNKKSHTLFKSNKSTTEGSSSVPITSKVKPPAPPPPKRETTPKRITKKKSSTYSSCLIFTLIISCMVVAAYLIICLIHFLLKVNYYFENSFNRFLNSKSNNFYSYDKVKSSLFFDFTDSIRVIESSSVTLDLNSVQQWIQIYNYITDFFLIFVCLFFYILFEFFLK